MSVGGKEPAEDYYEKGISLIKTSKPDYEEPITWFKLAIEKNPNLIKAWHWLGNSYFYKKDYDNAIKVYTEVLTKNLTVAQKVNVITNIAISHRHKEEYKKAVEWYENALSLDKKNSSTLNAYAYLLARTGNIQKAEEKIKEAIEIESANPNSPLLLHIHDTIGFILLNKGQHKAAEDEFLKITTIFEADQREKNRQENQTYATALASRGVALLLLRRFTEAIECFTKSLEINKQQNYNLLADTTRGHILTNVGHAFGFLPNGREIRQQKFSEAEEIYMKIIDAPGRTETEKMSAYNGLGVCYGLQERYNDAVDCFDKVIGAYAKKKSIVANTAREYLTAKDITLAYAYRNKGVALINLGKNTRNKELKEKYDTKENYEEAVDCFRKSLNIYPKLATAWNGKGVARLILTDYHKAVNYFKRAKEIMELTNAYYNEGRAYDQEKDFDKAVECFNNAIRIDQVCAGISQ
jgi:tetratricopeptide (TPR) repeat protein